MSRTFPSHHVTIRIWKRTRMLGKLMAKQDGLTFVKFVDRLMIDEAKRRKIKLRVNDDKESGIKIV